MAKQAATPPIPATTATKPPDKAPITCWLAAIATTMGMYMADQ